MFDWLPQSSDFYWAIVCIALALLNVYQYARVHGLSAKLGHVLTFGHAPEGKAIVPAASVTAGPSTATTTSKEGYL